MEYNIGTIVFGEWEIKRLLGEGGYGRVFEIEKTNYGITTKSALKVIRVPGSTSEIKEAMSEGMDERSVTTYFRGFVNEIIKEIVVMTSLKSHPGIVGYEDHEVIEHKDNIGWDILIRMELLTPVLDYQMSHAMDEETVVRMAKDISEVLMYCQQKGLIHRDIKPENIFVNEFGKFKLGDFGVARTLEKTTGGFSKKGTESYMAPEVYQGKAYNASVDIYSLGLVLYRYMNNNRLPFFPPVPQPITFSDREKALYRRMRGEQISPPRNASREFAQIIMKACAYHPEERYHSAEELLLELNKLEPKIIKPEPNVQYGGIPEESDVIEVKSKKKYGKYLIVGAALLLAATVAGTVFLKFAANSERDTSMQITAEEDSFSEEEEAVFEESEIIEEEIILKDDAYYEEKLVQIIEGASISEMVVDGVDLNSLTMNEFAEILDPTMDREIEVIEDEGRMHGGTKGWYFNAYTEKNDTVSSIILTISDSNWDRAVLKEVNSLLYFKELDVCLGDTREEFYEKLEITQDMLVWLKEKTLLGENNFTEYSWEVDEEYYVVRFNEVESTMDEYRYGEPSLYIRKNDKCSLSVYFFDERLGEISVFNYE